jgi:hypothetical protein
LKGNLEVEKYLKNYPLFGIKYLDSLDWMKVLDLFKSKDHMKQIEQINFIKSKMNDRRINFNWNHLQNFYKLD